MTAEPCVAGHCPLTVDIVTLAESAYTPHHQCSSRLHVQEQTVDSVGRHTPKFVLDSVSGARFTMNESLSNSVTVRHAPFTHMLSPTLQSSSIGAAWSILK